MADATLQILGLGTKAVPLDYNVTGDQSLDLVAVKADFDGTAAGSSFAPVVEIISPAGQIMAQSKGPVITAGNSATVTFAPFLDEPVTASGGGGITEIDNSDNSISVAGGATGPIVDLSTFRPQFSQSTGTATLVAPGAATVSWTFFLGDNFLDYTTPTNPTPATAGWYAVSAFAAFGFLSAPSSSCDARLTVSGGYAPSPTSEAAGLGSSAFGLVLAVSIPPLRMKTTGVFVLDVSTDSAAGCTVNAQLDVAWLRPD